MDSKTILRSMLAAAALTAVPAAAQETSDSPSWLKLGATVRVDWQYHHPDGGTDDSETGFRGKYIMLRADGELVKGLTYSWRQRFNKFDSGQGFFDATDWIYLNYSIAGWNVRAGKDVVAIGGWEYDRNPADLFGCSVFWNNIPCYQLGVSGGYDITKRDRLTLQIVQSPFAYSGNRNMYGYNLMWNGSHGPFKAIYSANLLEYAKGRYISYIALGNKVEFEKFGAEIDFMNRAAAHQTYLFKDCSVMGEIFYKPTPRWRIHAKMTYDVNKSGTDADALVTDGTELTMAGGGVEFYPLLKDKTSLRVHAAAYYSWGHNANRGDLMQSNTLFANIGLTWTMDFVNIKKK